MAVRKQLNKLSLIEAKNGLAQGQFTVSQLVDDCLKRIKETDDQIRAFISLWPGEARRLGKKYDRQLKKNPRLLEEKPLFGIPIAVKDNFCLKGKKTTAGSRLLDNFVSPYSATVVEKLIEAGAIILGKTNMDAWAHGSSTEASDFFTTKNPHDLSRLPGGSSGGSAAAVAADQVIAAIGSETAGSIRQPAAWCGVVGLKPSYGRVSRWGLIAMCSSTDSPGPITKTTADAALLLSLLAGRDERDGTTTDLAGSQYHLNLEKINPKSITIGLAKEYFPKTIDSQVAEAVKKAIGKLAGKGFVIKPVSLLDPQYSIAVYTIIQRAEVSSNLARYDGIRYGRKRKYFGEEAKRRIMLGTHVLSAGYYDQYYIKGQKARSLIRKDFDRVFQQVDVLIAPTSPSLPLKIGASEGEAMFGELQDVLVEASALAGLPGISIPCDWINGLPVAMQIIAPQFKEELVLKLAHFYEKNQ